MYNLNQIDSSLLPCWTLSLFHFLFVLSELPRNNLCLSLHPVHKSDFMSRWTPCAGAMFTARCHRGWSLGRVRGCLVGNGARVVDVGRRTCSSGRFLRFSPSHNGFFLRFGKPLGCLQRRVWYVSWLEEVTIYYNTRENILMLHDLVHHGLKKTR